MKLQHKISLLIIGILLVLSLIVSTSYALWIFNVSQESTNLVQSDCFEMKFNDKNQINLEYAFPMQDSLGVQLTPYEFTVTNVCNHTADLQINLETLETSTLDASNIKVDINGQIKLYSEAQSVEPTVTSAINAASFYEDVIVAGESKSYNVRIWIKEDALQEEIENTTYSSIVSVRATLRKIPIKATLISGVDFNVAIKTLSGDNNASYKSSNTSIKAIKKTENAPSENINYINVADENSDTPIYAWYDGETINLYCASDKIYANYDSSYMFSYLSNVETLDVSFLDTSNVTNMEGMFTMMKKNIDLDLSSFDTSKAVNMSSMFENSSLKSLNLSGFNTSEVTNMKSMFSQCMNLRSLDISSFNTSKVTDMSNMFGYMYNLESIDVSNFDTSNVTDMRGMFAYLFKIKVLDISNFNTSKVTNMSSMFASLNNLTRLDVSSFNTSNVTDMTLMFGYMAKITGLDLSNFNTSKVTSTAGMFKGCNNLTFLDISSFDTSNVRFMEGMFADLYKITDLDVGHFNTSNVRRMTKMFSNMRQLKNLDLSNFAPIMVGEIDEMFSGCDNLEKIYISDKWEAWNISSSSMMFSDCYNLVGGAGTTYDANNVDIEYARVDDPDNGKPGYFTLKTN